MRHTGYLGLELGQAESTYLDAVVLQLGEAAAVGHANARVERVRLRIVQQAHVGNEAAEPVANAVSAQRGQICVRLHGGAVHRDRSLTEAE